MRRRGFITFLGGAIAWPFAVDAQKTRTPVIGYFSSRSAATEAAIRTPFLRGLADAGFVVEQNVLVEYRFSDGRNDRLKELAAYLVRRQVSILVATDRFAASAAKAATSTIPIVFQTGSDPVTDGLVASFNRPGGNVTGVARLTTELVPKRFEIISDLVPKATVIGYLGNPKGIQTAAQILELQEATRAHGIKLHVAYASDKNELDAAFTALAQAKVIGLIEGSDPLFIDLRKKIVDLTNSHKLPTIFFERDSVVEGGLITYSANFADSFRQVGVYVGRILKGDKPADLPVLQAAKFDLIINLKTAKMIGLTIPPGLLATADEVIE